MLFFRSPRNFGLLSPTAVRPNPQQRPHVEIAPGGQSIRPNTRSHYCARSDSRYHSAIRTQLSPADGPPHTHTHTLGRAPYKNSKYYVSRMLKITVYVSVYNYACMHICICMDVCMSPCRPSLLIEPNCNCKYDNYHYYHCETIYISIMNSITIVILKSYCYGYYENL